MKKLFVSILISIFVFSVSPVLSAESSTAISKEEALALAQKEFQGQDVDYFLLKDDNTTTWTIFVDAEPMKGWEHDCYLITIPKDKGPKAGIINISKTLLQLPPEGNMEILSVKDRFGYNSNGNQPPLVLIGDDDRFTEETSAVAKRTYAVIISGGIEKDRNYFRYWNDCSFIYQTLTKKYGIPKENIYPIMSDGDDPDVDMSVHFFQYISQPLDLDFDGINDIKLAATKNNVKNTLCELSTKLKEDDHLFIFVIDHGGRISQNSYICLWGRNERLYDYELAEALAPFAQNYVNINVVLGQCKSGGFIDDLKDINGCVVVAACEAEESSFACGDIPYDEFVYLWTCAVNGANHLGDPIESDLDGNLRTTMLEAFNYAKTHDRKSEQPQYNSNPVYVGDDLSFTYLPPAVDLYLKDNYEDLGIEQNSTTDKNWLSPSICIRNSNDGIFEHESPIFTEDDEDACLYVRVYNRGKKNYTGGKWLHTYWALASTGVASNIWDALLVEPAVDPRGGKLVACEIAPIAVGDSVTMEMNWSMPDLLYIHSDDNDVPVSILANISGTSLTMPVSAIGLNILGKRSQALRSTAVIKQKYNDKTYKTYIRNIAKEAATYSLEFEPVTETDSELFTKATVELEMSQAIYDAWVRGGCHSSNVEQTEATGGMTFKLLSDKSKFESINLNKGEFGTISLKFKFPSFNKKPSVTYTCDLIQKDNIGNTVGGVRYAVESSSILGGSIPIDPVDPYFPTDGSMGLKVDGDTYNSIGWQNEKGEVIGRGESITVRPTINNTTFYVYAKTSEGETATGSITLEIMDGIKTVKAGSGAFDIQLKKRAPENATIRISSTLDGSLIAEVPVEINSMEVSISTLAKPGIYIVTYTISGEIIDQQRISVN